MTTLYQSLCRFPPCCMLCCGSWCSARIICKDYMLQEEGARKVFYGHIHYASTVYEWYPMYCHLNHLKQFPQVTITTLSTANLEFPVASYPRRPGQKTFTNRKSTSLHFVFRVFECNNLHWEDQGRLDCYRIFVVFIASLIKI